MIWVDAPKSFRDGYDAGDSRGMMAATGRPRLGANGWVAREDTKMATAEEQAQAVGAVEKELRDWWAWWEDAGRWKTCYTPPGKANPVFTDVPDAAKYFTEADRARVRDVLAIVLEHAPLLRRLLTERECHPYIRPKMMTMLDRAGDLKRGKDVSGWWVMVTEWAGPHLDGGQCSVVDELAEWVKQLRSEAGTGGGKDAAGGEAIPVRAGGGEVIKAFISYSHDSPEHKQRVLAFANALRSHGIHVELDQFHEHQIIDWPRWCNGQLDPEHSDFVIIVCTAQYKRHVEGGALLEKGKGAYWEGSQFDDDIYDAKGNRRIIPVLFDDEPEQSILRILRGWTHCRVGSFALSDTGYERLLRILTHRASVTMNPVGPIPPLLPRS